MSFRPRRPTAVLASIVVHAIALAGAVSLNQIAARNPRVLNRQSVTFMVFAPPLAPLEVPTTEPLVVPASAMAIRPPEPEEARAELTAPPEPEPKPAPKPPPVKPSAPPPRVAAVIAPPKPVTGVFPDATSTRSNPDPGRQLQDVTFDAPAARASAPIKAAAVVGAFDRTAAAPQPGTDRPAGAVVEAAGFGAATAPARAASRSSQTPSDAGFDSGTASPSPQARRVETVQATGFGDAREIKRPAPPETPKPERIDTPVEIVFKPMPDYTEEARALKLEGEVVLEVDFRASGEIHIVRVVQGLGHGLDESAARAAQRIRFKPAQSARRPVDFRSTVHIIFKLT